MSSENAREIYKINPQMVLLLCPVAKFEYRLGLLTKKTRGELFTAWLKNGMIGRFFTRR